MRRRPLSGALVVVVGLTACMPTTERDLQLAQTINEMSQAVNDIRTQMMYMQDQIDSLSTISTRQDSVIRTLANLAGVAVPR